jgi:hypothetical protein
MTLGYGPDRASHSDESSATSHNTESALSSDILTSLRVFRWVPKIIMGVLWDLCALLYGVNHQAVKTTAQMKHNSCLRAL